MGCQTSPLSRLLICHVTFTKTIQCIRFFLSRSDLIYLKNKKKKKNIQPHPKKKKKKNKTKQLASDKNSGDSLESPLHGSIKVNWDSAVDRHKMKLGISVVIRNSMGEVLPMLFEAKIT
jgi:hypothetical protein